MIKLVQCNSRETAEHLINRLYRQDIPPADPVWRSDQISNCHGKALLQGSFYKVSPFCVFGIPPLHRLFFTVEGL